jgi:hypothetical protein
MELFLRPASLPLSELRTTQSHLMRAFLYWPEIRGAENETDVWNILVDVHATGCGEEQ